AITDVAVLGDSIAVVGDLSKSSADQVFVATGLILAPGFIDVHSHHAGGLKEDPSGLAMVSQGVTTIVTGQDGGSRIPLADYFRSLEESPVAVNIASYAGHNSIRDSVMGEEFKRKATSEEVERMAAMLKKEMEAGALGLSTGLEYDPGIYSDPQEVLTLARELPAYGGRYISHLRSEDRWYDAALKEIITIGAETGVPVQISHFKLAMRALWGKSKASLIRLDSARKAGINITADIYPYPYWSSTIRVLFPDRNFTDLKEAAFILKEVTTPEGIIFSSYDPNPEYNGKSLADAAAIEKRTPENMLVELIRRLDECEKSNPDCDGSIVATSMDERDIAELMRWPWSGICSDGNSGGRHPRGFGAFTRVIKKYVREDSVLTMEEAVRRMTTLNAESLGIKKRGKIMAGNKADLVLFDPTTVGDRATIADPHALSTGIESVWVNGQPVYRKTGVTGARPGKVLRRE
ncbi:MAG: N-acyl-D-amino-acid deacylase family protein, partial [Bacteroidota bacterium]